MKKVLRLSLMSGVFVSVSALACDTWDLNCDGRIDYEEGLKSTQEYREQRKSVSRGAPREGLPDPVEAGYPDMGEGSSIQSGIWVKISRQPLDIKSYVVLSGDSSGYACAPSGVYGKQPYEECVHVGNGDYRCKTYNNYYQCQ